MPANPREKALALLVRLERTNLELCTRELSALAYEAARCEDAQRALERAIAYELEAGLALPGGPAPCGSWISAAFHRAHELEQRRAELARRRDALEAELRDRRRAARRYELLLERVRATHAQERVRAERETLDERAALRAARLRTQGRG